MREASTASVHYADLKNALVPIAAVQTTPRLVVPFDPADWLADRKARMAEALERLAAAAKADAIPGGSIEDGSLKLERLSAAVPAEAEDLVLDLYKRLPDVRITDLLLEVDDATGFTEAFTRSSCAVELENAFCPIHPDNNILHRPSSLARNDNKT